MSRGEPRTKGLRRQRHAVCERQQLAIQQQDIVRLKGRLGAKEVFLLASALNRPSNFAVSRGELGLRLSPYQGLVVVGRHIGRCR